jgi:hypothetical protein
MRKLVVVLVVIAGLLVGADRGSAYVAERAVAKRVQLDQRLVTRPDVTVHGVPFLTQLFRGRYDDIEVSMGDLHAGALRVAGLTVNLHGAHVPFKDVVRRDVKRVPVEQATARVLLRFGDLSRVVAGGHLTLSRASDDRVHVSGSAGGLSADVDVRPAVAGDALVLNVNELVALRWRLGSLPYGLRLSRVTVTDEGLAVTGVATDVVLVR